MFLFDEIQSKHTPYSHIPQIKFKLVFQRKLVINFLPKCCHLCLSESSQFYLFIDVFTNMFEKWLGEDLSLFIVKFYTISLLMTYAKKFLCTFHVVRSLNAFN